MISIACTTLEVIEALQFTFLARSGGDVKFANHTNLIQNVECKTGIAGGPDGWSLRWSLCGHVGLIFIIYVLENDARICRLLSGCLAREPTESKGRMED